MEPTAILMSEHRVIEQVLDCLDVIADRARTTSHVNQELAEQALSFLREFADRCHHGKEEGVLFPHMEARGFSRAFGPTGVMLDEHTQGRDLIKAMGLALPAAAKGEPAAVAAFLQSARAYTELLRQHINKEDHCLFPMANRAFTREDQAEVFRGFEAIEHKDLGPGTHQRYLDLAQELVRKCGVKPADEGVFRGAASCCEHH